MMPKAVHLEKRGEIVLYGVWGTANDRTIDRDIERMSTAYHCQADVADKMVLPFYVLSRNYVPETGASELFIGSCSMHAGLKRMVLPAGQYARMTVRPWLGAWWGAAIGRAKRYFYTKWLPQSDYQPRNMEYEYHDQRSVAKRATVDIVFAIEARAPEGE